MWAMTHTRDRPELQVQQHLIDFHSTEWKLEHRLGVSHERHRQGRKSHFIVGGIINSKILENNSGGDKE